MNDIQKKPNYLKANLILLGLDLLALLSYFGFEALAEVADSISNKLLEITIDEGYFHTFIALFVVAFHIIVILGEHSPIANQSYKDKFYKVSLISTFFIALFSGYFISYYVDSKLESANYHFCDSLSYEKRYRATHYVWRAEGVSCDADLTVSQPGKPVVRP